MVKVTEKTLAVDCEANSPGKRAVIRRSAWSDRSVMRAVVAPDATQELLAAQANGLCPPTTTRMKGPIVDDLATLPVSSVPAAFDRGRLYSPDADTVAYGIDYRPGDQFEPMPPSPRGNPPAWGEWWRTVAHISVPDYLGLKAGRDITIQHPCSVGSGTVVATYRSGALVRYPMPVGAEKPYADMYVHRRNHLGHWY